MSAYNPPAENLSTFNTINFSGSSVSQSNNTQAGKNYLEYPIAQGTETFRDVTINGFANFSGSASFPIPPSCSATTFTSQNLITQAGLLPLTNAWTGDNLFDIHLPTSVLTPTTAKELTTKSYVDSKITNSALLTTNNTWSGTNSFNTYIPTTTKTNTSTNTTEFASVGYVNGLLSSYLLVKDSLSFLTKSVADTLYATQTYVNNAINTQSQSIANNYLTPSQANAKYLSITDAESSYVTWNNATLTFAPISKPPIQYILTHGMSGIFQPPVGALHLVVNMIGGGSSLTSTGYVDGKNTTFKDGKSLSLSASGGNSTDAPFIQSRNTGGDINYMGQGSFFTGLSNGLSVNYNKAGYGIADALVKRIYPVQSQYTFFVGKGGSSPYNDGLIVVTAYFQ